MSADDVSGSAGPPETPQASDAAPVSSPESPRQGTFEASAKGYLSGSLNRRSFVANIVAAGVSTGSALRLSEALAEPSETADAVQGSRPEIIDGRGGDLFAEQLRRCGVEYIFNNPATGTAPIFDAVLTSGGPHVVGCPHEGPLMAMADGYAKASGRVPYVSVARLGVPNTLANMFNAMRDRTPLIMGADQVPESVRGGFAFQEVEDLIAASEPYSRWRWETRRTDSIPADLRRAYKFALTPPYGPVFLSVPEDLLFERGRAEVADISGFTLIREIRADEALVDEIAERLLRAESPLLYVGDDVYRTGGEKEVVALAELASLPTVESHRLWHWASNFPTEHPLYLGEYKPRMRYPEAVDLVLNIGGALPVPGGLPAGAELIEIRGDIESMGRVYPGAFHIPANAGLFATDLLEAVRRKASASTLRGWREGRGKATRDVSAKLRRAREMAARGLWSDSPIAVERIGKELSEALDPDAAVVAELDGGRPIVGYLPFAQDGRRFFGTTGTALGWAVGASAGVKLALPERQVVAVMGDGAFLFSGDQALWTMRRYGLAVTVIVLNNQSYDNERRRIWGHEGSVQAAEGKDMTCYLGDPAIDFTHLARAYGIEGSKVESSDDFRPALARAFAANRRGDPYLVDLHVGRRGLGRDVTWYPPLSTSE